MPPTEIPAYRIDLALPPEHRYSQLARDFAGPLAAIAPLYDLVLAQILVYRPTIRLAQLLVRLCLRRVFDDEETREIRAIAHVTGVDLHLLVAFNTLLDCMLGCTSGTVPVRDGNTPAHLMHFRALDWGMPQLGHLLVHLEFVNSKSANPGEVLARSITYAGFVGSLTGVRPGLALSLNHRPLMNAKTTWSIIHQIRVVLGQKPSISSILRQVLLSPTLPDYLSTKNVGTAGLVSFAKLLTGKPSPPCYLIFSTPHEAVVVQKDFIGGSIKTTHDFIAQANHDTDHRVCCGAAKFHHLSIALGDSSPMPPEDAWLSQSAERENFVRDHWKAYKQRSGNAGGGASRDSTNGSCVVASTLTTFPDAKKYIGVPRELLRRWVLSDPVFNEYTHFATIMDPLSGDIVCLEKNRDESP